MTARRSRPFRRALDEFGSLDYLLIAVRLPEDAVLDPYEEFVDDLGARLERREMLERVEYRLGEMDEMVGTFLPRAILFLDAAERRQLLERLGDDALVERARELRRLVETPQAMALEELLKLDPLGLAEIFLQRLTASRSGLSLDWTSGYMLSNDHRMLLVLARPRHSPEDIDRNRLLVDAVREDVAAALGGWSDLVRDRATPPPEVALGGRYVIALGDDQLIRRDVLTNVVTSMVGVLVLFLFAFRRFGPLLYAFVPLSCGLILTFGFTFLAFGELNAATSGVAALLIGLGIDFVIVSYGRFVEERQAGATLEEGLARMSGSSGRAVIVGGVTSAATFYAFAVTDFTGLREMGTADRHRHPALHGGGGGPAAGDAGGGRRPAQPPPQLPAALPARLLERRPDPPLHRPPAPGAGGGPAGDAGGGWRCAAGCASTTRSRRCARPATPVLPCATRWAATSAPASIR